MVFGEYNIVLVFQRCVAVCITFHQILLPVNLGHNLGVDAGLRIDCSVAGQSGQNIASGRAVKYIRGKRYEALLGLGAKNPWTTALYFQVNFGHTRIRMDWLSPPKTSLFLFFPFFFFFLPFPLSLKFTLYLTTLVAAAAETMETSHTSGAGSIRASSRLIDILTLQPSGSQRSQLSCNQLESVAAQRQSKSASDKSIYTRAAESWHNATGSSRV